MKCCLLSFWWFYLLLFCLRSVITQNIWNITSQQSGPLLHILPLSLISAAHPFASSPCDFLHGWLLFLLLQAQPSAHIDRSPSSSASPRLYLTMASNSPTFTLLHSRLRGSEKKINNSAKWGGVRGQRGLWQVCQGKEGVKVGKKTYLSVCVFHKEWSRERGWPKASWVQVSGLSRIKFMTIDRGCARVCVWWMCVFVWIMAESDRGEESSHKAHYNLTSQWNKWIPWDVQSKSPANSCIGLSIRPFVSLGFTHIAKMKIVTLEQHHHFSSHRGQISVFRSAEEARKTHTVSSVL